MPMYEFQCPNCGVPTTELCRMGENGDSLVCTECGYVGLTKRISGFASPGISGGIKSGNCSQKSCLNCTGCH